MLAHRPPSAYRSNCVVLIHICTHTYLRRIHHHFSSLQAHTFPQVAILLRNCAMLTPIRSTPHSLAISYVPLLTALRCFALLPINYKQNVDYLFIYVFIYIFIYIYIYIYMYIYIYVYTYVYLKIYIFIRLKFM